MTAITTTSESNGDILPNIFSALLEQVLKGSALFDSAENVYQKYKRNTAYRSVEERIDAVIRAHSLNSFAVGFLTGLGGAVTLPVTLPASLAGSLMLQMRMVVVICRLCDHDYDRDEQLAVLFQCMFGLEKIAKNMGVKCTEKAARKAIASLSKKTLRKLNLLLGRNIVTKGGLIRLLPVLGGGVGGGVDALSCAALGKTTKMLLLNRRCAL